MGDEKPGCQIDRLPAGCALEFAFFAWPGADPGVSDWPSTPGAILRDPAHRSLMLHFAPGRWLVPEPSVESRELLNKVALAGLGMIVEVTGKYDPLTITGPGATRLLACGIDVEAILQGRECAALTLFDAPVILARMPEGYSIWVQSSYSADFVRTAEGFRVLLESGF